MGSTASKRWRAGRSGGRVRRSRRAEKSSFEFQPEHTRRTVILASFRSNQRSAIREREKASRLEKAAGSFFRWNPYCLMREGIAVGSGEDLRTLRIRHVTAILVDFMQRFSIVFGETLQS